MTPDPLTGYIRAKVIGVFCHGRRILVCEGYDPTKQQAFYCPLGGRIEFGEPSDVALRREMEEEIGAAIENLRLLGVLENRFTFDGRAGHEIVFVYDAAFVDRSLYALDRIEGHEDRGQPFTAVWLDLDALAPDTPPLYPHGLLALLANA